MNVQVVGEMAAIDLALEIPIEIEDSVEIPIEDSVEILIEDSVEILIGTGDSIETPIEIEDSVEILKGLAEILTEVSLIEEGLRTEMVIDVVVLVLEEWIEMIEMEEDSAEVEEDQGMKFLQRSVNYNSIAY